VNRSPAPYVRATAGLRTGVRAIVIAALTVVALMVAGVPQALAATQYWLNPSHTVPHGPNDHCFTQYPWTDLLPTAPTGATSVTSTGGVLFGCTPAFPLGASLGADSNQLSHLDVWFTNTYNKSSHPKSCTVPWFLQHNATPNNAGDTITGTTLNGNPGITVPPNTTTPTEFTVNFNVPATSLGQNDQLMLWVDIRTQTGPCSQMTLYWGSATTPSDLSLPTLVG
jgi:hypothetical protein